MFLHSFYNFNPDSSLLDTSGEPPFVLQLSLQRHGILSALKNLGWLLQFYATLNEVISELEVLLLLFVKHVFQKGNLWLWDSSTHHCSAWYAITGRLKTYLTVISVTIFPHLVLPNFSIYLNCICHVFFP